MAVEPGDSSESIIDERRNDKVEENICEHSRVEGLGHELGRAGTFGFRPQHCGPRDLFKVDVIGCLVRIEW